MPTQTSRGKLYNQLRLMQDSARPGSVGALGGVLGMDEALPQQPRRNTLADALAVGSMLPGAGDALGVAADAHMYATDPSSRKLSNYLLSGAGALLPGIGGATVFHGSPHKFDVFDSTKIGTGEGAQAYGHGLYMADKKEVAQGYKDALTPRTGTWDASVNGVNLFDAAAAHGTTGYASAFSQKYFDLVKGGRTDNQAKQQILAQLKKRIDTSKSPGDIKGSQEAFDFITKSKIDMPQGSLYTVDLPDEHINNFLDWDKPLSQQTDYVRNALEPLGYSSKSQVAKYEDDLLASLNGGASDPLEKIRDPMGSDIARGGGLFDSRGQIEKAKRLKELGIPGIRYLDAGSRGAGAGSSNYVVFDDKLLKILKRE